MSSHPELRVDGDRLWSRLAALGEVGAVHGPNGERGNARLALSDADRDGRDLVVRWMHDLGLVVQIDAVGNVVGTLAYMAPERFSGREVLSPDYLRMVHLFAQAVWDVRSTLAWIRSRTGEPVGLYGVSLGGYVSALAAAFEPDLACVIAGIPAVDFPGLASDNQPWIMRRYEDDLEIDWKLVRAVSHVVSPLALPPQRLGHAGSNSKAARLVGVAQHLGLASRSSA